MHPNTLLVFRIALVAALGGLLFGFDTAVISGAEQTLQQVYQLSDGWLGFTVASALVGTIIGALAAGRPTDQIGRRSMLIVLAVFYFVSAVGSAAAWDWWSFVAFRFIGGLAVGGASVVSPLYIAEVSPAASRGRLVALAQLNIVVGILLAFVSNYVIASLGLGSTEWRWMFGVEAAPAALFFALLFTNPRSPRWLLTQSRRDEALSVLSRLEPSDTVAQQELIAIEESLGRERYEASERLFSATYAKPIFLACAIAVFNQLSGINAVLYYAPRIFKLTGAGGESTMLQSVLLGLVNLVFTVAALAVIDRIGRKTLMLVGSIGYILSLGIIAWTFISYEDAFVGAIQAMDAVSTAESSGVDAEAVAALKEAEIQAYAGVADGGAVILVGLVAFIASHAFGQGAVVWVFVSEIFPNRVRARGQAVAAFSLWVACAAISQTFPIVVGKFGGGAIFTFYFGCMVLQLLWVIFLMPETKGVPLEDIQKKLGIE